MKFNTERGKGDVEKYVVVELLIIISII